MMIIILLVVWTVYYDADIMTGKAELAYDVYRNMDVSSESMLLLDFIANECYKVHH